MDTAMNISTNSSGGIDYAKSDALVPHNRHLGLSVIAIVVAGLIAYCNTAQVPFLLDDSWRIVDNPSIHSLWTIQDAFLESNRPVVNVSFVINYAIHGLDLPGYHVTNLFIHLAAGLCLYGLVRRLLSRSDEYLAKRAASLALIISILWVVHPLQTSAVTYINQRFESMMGFAYLGTLYLFLRALDSNHPNRWYLASIIVCGVGMLCKEVMVSAPLIAIWLDRAFVSRSWGELFRKRSGYHLSLLGTWGLMAWAMLHYTQEYVNGGMLWVEGLNSWTYLLSQSAVIVHYLRLTVWPVGQTFVYDWPIARSIQEVLPQMSFMVILFLATMWAMFRSPKMGFLGGCFFLILAPTSSIFPIMDLAFEHRMYLPLASVIAPLVLGFDRILLAFGTTRHIEFSIRMIFGSVALLGLIGLTYLRNHDFRSEIAIWRATLDRGHSNSKAWLGVGCALVKLGEHQEACDCFEKAVTLLPKSAIHQANYGSALYELGEYDKAEKHLLEAIRIKPDDQFSLQCLGNIMLDRGRIAEAIQYCEKAVRIAPTYAEVRMSLVAALIEAGQLERAIQECKSTLKNHPGFAIANLNMAIALKQLGRFDEAIEQCRDALVVEPNISQAHWMLGVLLSDSQPEQAVMHLGRAIDLEPEALALKHDYINALVKSDASASVEYLQELIVKNPADLEWRYKLVSVLVSLKDLKRAITEMDKVLELRPNSQAAREYLDKLRMAAAKND
jgi:protein O-mannosyl-transferase